LSDSPAPALLLVDDEPAALAGSRRILRAAGFERVLTCAEGNEVVSLVETETISLVLLDLIMPHRNGQEILGDLMARWPELPVIVLTAEQELTTAVACMKLGATDYLLKPVGPEQLVATVQKALDHSALRDENARLREGFFGEAPRRLEAFAEIVTDDPAMLRVFAYLEAIAHGSQPVLIAGETGTGKELVARALHDVGDRPGPFVALNAAGLDDTMFSDALFGHRSGAFTGAREARKGLIETAGTGTLFLDEIGDLKEASQVKLLRLLQEREYYPLGSDTPRRLRARVVAATHRDPSALREDLYYRLRA
jgi:DNA-binding NtrC family response regulator